MRVPRGQTFTLGPRPLAPCSADHQQRTAHGRGHTLRTPLWRVGRSALAIVVGTAFLVAYANAVVRTESGQTALTTESIKEAKHLIATLRRATARYHDLAAALNDGFVLLHECETRPGEGAVGTVYVHLGHLMVR